MRGIFPTFCLFLFGCLFPTSETDTRRILPPRNLSARWVSDFQLGLFWDPPLNVGPGCKYFMSRTLRGQTRGNTLAASPWLFEPMDGGHLRCTVATACDGVRSEPAVLDVSFPELVKDLECFLLGPGRASCRWTPATGVQDLRFFYELQREDFESETPTALQECPSYACAGAARTGCDLAATEFDVVRVLMKGTQENRPLNGTFERPLIDDAVRAPPLRWDVTRIGEEFNISWVPPDIILPKGWAIEINRTECNGAEKVFSADPGKTFHVLPRTPHCPSKFAIRAKSPHGQTPWSDWKQPDDGPNVLLYVAILVPAVIVVLTTSICVCLQRNKEKIFPKVPEPRNFLSDLYDTTKTTVYDLYVPAREEEGCRITLVAKPQPSKSA